MKSKVFFASSTLSGDSRSPRSSGYLRSWSLIAVVLAAFLVPLAQFALAQDQQTQARGLTEDEIRDREERLREELESPYRRWMDEEVIWIISEEEKRVFGMLETDEERQTFVEDFWLRRDPTPDTLENEIREEHYRRIAYANDQFASGIPGWKTDRGMVYIKYGAPDEREQHPTGGRYNRLPEEGGGTTNVFPFERWRYRYLEGVGTQVILEFVDKSMTNEYRLTWDPNEKDALLFVPNAGLTTYEQLGVLNKADRIYTPGGFDPAAGNLAGGGQSLFDRIMQYNNIQKMGTGVQFTDLEALVESNIRYDLLPMKVRTDFIPATASTVTTNVTLQFDRRDLQFKTENDLTEGTVNVYMTVQTMSRRPVGRPVEETVTIGPYPADMMAQVIEGSAVYQTSFFLAPGRYRLRVVAKDVVADATSTYDVALDVPRVREDRLATSSLILADLLEKVPTRSIGAGQFVIGTNKVRPKVDDTFRASDTMGIYMQIYNFQFDEESRKPQGNITYVITKSGAEEPVLEFTEDLTSFEGGASQIVVAKRLPLANLNLEPGEYTLRIRVTDELRNESLSPSALFTVI